MQNPTHFARCYLAKSRYDFPVIGFKKWFCPLEELFCSFRGEDNDIVRVFIMDSASCSFGTAIPILSKIIAKKFSLLRKERASSTISPIALLKNAF